MIRTGSQVVMESLAREGADVVFGYPGGVVLPLYDEMLKWPHVRHILVRHEQCAAHMADGYARSTGKVGVCLATSGPGATNLVTGVATAMMDSVPMVAITGQVASPVIGKDAFQETDIQGITIPITKHNYLVTDVDDLPHVMTEAFYLARTGRKGPVLVDIPKDVFLGETENDFPSEIKRRGYRLPGPPRDEEIQAAAAAFATAERPVVIAGAGVVWSGASGALVELAERTGVPVANSLLGLGSIPREHPNSLGMMGMHGIAAATYAVQEADLVISIGSRFDDRLTGATQGFAPLATIVHFDLDDSEFDKTIGSSIKVHGDLAQTLPAFVAAVSKKNLDAWWQRIHTWQKHFPVAYPEGDHFLARNVIKGVAEVTGGDAIISTDVGQHQMWVAQIFPFKRPYQILSSGGLGTMGFGFPAAAGAAFANPDKQVWAIVGDGGFQMTLQELQVAYEHNLNVKIALINNGYLGMVRQWQEMFYDNRYSHVEVTSPHYGKLAEAYDIPYFRCDSQDCLEKTLKDAQAIQGPTLLEFGVEMEENVFPMVPAGHSNDKVIMDPALENAKVSGGRP